MSNMTHSQREKKNDGSIEPCLIMLLQLPILSIMEENNPLLESNNGETEVMMETSEIVPKQHAFLVAHCLSAIALLTVLWWISSLGKLSAFDFHPLLMILAFFFMTVATLAFRRLEHGAGKRLHWISWSVAALCLTVALSAVVYSHNKGPFIANLYSFHSWMGVLVVTLYLTQFLVGISAFLVPRSSLTAFRATILVYHKIVGHTIYNLMAVTILLGIQEKEGFVGCSYAVQQPDIFPPRHFFQIPLACRISHLLGLLVVATALCTNVALMKIP
jgi:cytochrome b-561